MRKLGILFLVFVILLSFGLAGCKSEDTATETKPDNEVNETNNNTETETETESSKDGGVLRYAIWSSPKGLFNPSVYEDNYDANVIDLIYAGMLRLNPDLEYEPDMAEKFEVSDDSKTLTFWLRKDLKWHDGTPVTTEDVKFTFETIAHADYTGVRYNDIEAIVGIEEYHNGEADEIKGIEIIDKHTIKITTTDVYAPGLADIGARQIIPKHIWGNIPLSTWEEAVEALSNPIGCGPFKLKHYEVDQFVELEAYEDYHFGRPKLDKFIIQVSNQQTAQAQLAAGQIDFIEVSSLNAIDLGFYESVGIKVDIIESDGYQYLGPNLRKEIFQDKRVRKALMHAINRQAFVDEVLEGYGSVCNVPYASISWAYPKDGYDEYPYDPQKAITLLEEAGWEYNDGVMYRNGEPVKLTLKYSTGNVPRERSAPIIQKYLADIGIELELSVMEFTSLIQQVIYEHDFELFLMGWTLTVDPDATGVWHSSQTELGKYNMVGFINEKSDELMHKGRFLLDIEDRLPIYQEWGQLMNEELPAIFLYSMQEGRAYVPNLKGTQIYPYDDFYNVQEWYYED